jgi:putative N-acetylmannosamine-6-phosphate epimerase
MVEKNKIVAQHRSNLLTMADWHQLEQEHLAPIKSGSGIIGKTKINLTEEKKKILE